MHSWSPASHFFPSSYLKLMHGLTLFISITDIYRIMLSDKKYGLSVNIMATRVTPSLLPQTVNPSLNLEQFTILIEVIEKMTISIRRIHITVFWIKYMVYTWCCWLHVHALHKQTQIHNQYFLFVFFFFCTFSLVANYLLHRQRIYNSLRNISLACLLFHILLGLLLSLYRIRTMAIIHTTYIYIYINILSMLHRQNQTMQTQQNKKGRAQQ